MNIAQLLQKLLNAADGNLSAEVEFEHFGLQLEDDGYVEVYKDLEFRHVFLSVGNGRKDAVKIVLKEPND